MYFKKMTAALSAMVLAAGTAASLPAGTSANAAEKYNYAEALQKSMFFYEVQQSGKLPEWNEVSWRGDSMVNEDGEETDVVPGGWFDAGDHFKFTLTNAYSASIMAWGYIQYKDAVDKAGLGELYRNNIQWGMDYVMACDKGGGSMVGTIGDFKGGSTDHNIWCSAEVYLRKHHLNGGDWDRPYDVIKNASVAGLSAACLAQGYIIFKDTQPDKAAEYLKHAKDLFEGADKIRDNKDIGGMTGMYNTDSWLDDCMYAANWLYMATGDKSYLEKIEKDYIPNFPLENQSTDRKYTWGLCWDDTSQAAAFLYALNTNDKSWIDHIAHHLDYWSPEGYGGKKVDYTPDGMAWLFNWGSARHVTTTAFLAKLASDTIFKDDATLSKKYDDWAKGQMDYVFGDNGLKMSYVLGMGDNQPTAFHHRTASGIHDDHWNDLGQASGGAEGWQTEYAHTLYGALVGGPDKSGKYVNDVSQYQYSEVAIDYNAGYTACLCAMVDDFGGSIDPSFPPDETPKWAEWEVAAIINGTPATSYTEIKAWAMNHTAWPARVAKDIEYRYFFDVSELIEAGYSTDIIKVEGKSQQYTAGEQGYATVTGPYKYEGDPSGNTYYASIKFEDGRAIQPTGQSEHRDEVQFRISVPDAIDGKATTGAWDAENDWSYMGGLAKATDLKKADSLNKHIPMYVDGVLVWGVEPDGTEAQVTTPTKPSNSTPTVTTTTTADPVVVTTTTTEKPTEPVVTTTGDILPPSENPDEDLMYGDANCDGKITLADSLAILQFVANEDKYPLTEKGKKQADVDGAPGITANDSVEVQRYDVGAITKFTVEK